MSKDDLEIIPILEDVVVAGDPDKAVTGDIDVKDLESIESFDAVLDDTKQNDNEEIDEEITESDRLPFSNDDLTADALMDETINNESVEESEMTDEGEYPTEPSESFESIIAEYENSVDETEDIAIDEQDFIREVSEPDNHESENHGQEIIEQTFHHTDSDIKNDTATQDDDEHNTDEQDLDNQDINTFDKNEDDSQNNIHSIGDQQETQIDVNQLTENVMQEIMPTLETQIRSLVLASLEKHLSQSVSLQENEVNTDDDEDL